MPPEGPGRSRAVSRAEGLAGTGDTALRVDTYQGAPPPMARFATMNPFTFVPHWRIPVPGQPGRYASSMESVWQGLKVVDGRTEFAMFAARPRKRPPDAARSPDFDYAATSLLFGDTTVDLITGRFLVYLPAYLHVLDRLVPDEVVTEILDALRDGRDVLFFDWDSNFDIFDVRSSFSHSSILAAWFGGRLEREFAEPYRRLLPGPGRPDTVRAAGTELPMSRYLRVHEGKGLSR